MQPCSQPRYGLIDCSKWISGESLRLMIERARSSVTCVSGRGAGSSSRYQPSSSRVFAIDSKRPSGFEAAPRPLMREGASMRCNAASSVESRFMRRYEVCARRVSPHAKQSRASAPAGELSVLAEIARLAAQHAGREIERARDEVAGRFPIGRIAHANAQHDEVRIVLAAGKKHLLHRRPERIDRRAVT